MKKTLSKRLFIHFPITGLCEMNIPLVIKLWQNQWTISQWHDNEYKFCDAESVKASISKIQALEIIRKLELVATQSTTLNNGLTWMNISQLNASITKGILIRILKSWLEEPQRCRNTSDNIPDRICKEATYVGIDPALLLPSEVEWQAHVSSWKLYK